MGYITHNYYIKKNMVQRKPYQLNVIKTGLFWYPIEENFKKEKP